MLLKNINIFDTMKKQVEKAKQEFFSLYVDEDNKIKEK